MTVPLWLQLLIKFKNNTFEKTTILYSVADPNQNLIQIRYQIPKYQIRPKHADPDPQHLFYVLVSKLFVSMYL
jgi:hypothetical protein